MQHDDGEVLAWLMRLTASPSSKVQCQACLALRNLASDDANQVRERKEGGRKKQRNKMIEREREGAEGVLCVCVRVCVSCPSFSLCLCFVILWIVLCFFGDLRTPLTLFAHDALGSDC